MGAYVPPYIPVYLMKYILSIVCRQEYVTADFLFIATTLAVPASDPIYGNSTWVQEVLVLGPGSFVLSLLKN